jgi:enediyne biosynthesis protein E8
VQDYEGLSADQVMTLEAYADTIIPGERRAPNDRAVAGAAAGGGAVASGAVELMVSPEGGLAGSLDSLAEGLNVHAHEYASRIGLDPDPTVPPFVALEFADRVSLARELLAPGHPEQELWVALAMFSVMAWDTGAHMHTVEALASGHPGLTLMGFMPPDSDGTWRFPRFSYGRALAALHPRTTSRGDPE